MTRRSAKSWNVWAALAVITALVWLARPRRVAPAPARSDESGERPRPEARHRAPRPSVADAGDSPWTSSGACERALPARPALAPGLVRVGSWNLHWFPDGVPGREAPASGGTDIAWLACAMATLDVDVLAIQEIKTLPRARARMSDLVDRLAALTGRHYAVALDPCDNESGQHVGFLYDPARARPGAFHTYASLNPLGEPCKDQLRPGYGAHFVFSGGLDAHLVSVHSKSGPDRRAFELRKRAVAGMAAAYREAQALDADPDVLVLGDFNTMGCAHCSPSVSATAEVEALRDELGELAPRFRLVEQSAQCSEYSSGRGTLLDQFAVTAQFAGLPASRRASVGGLCEQTQCRRVSEASQKAYEALSDHCPVLLDLDSSGPR